MVSRRRSTTAWLAGGSVPASKITLTSYGRIRCSPPSGPGAPAPGPRWTGAGLYLSSGPAVRPTRRRTWYSTARAVQTGASDRRVPDRCHRRRRGSDPLVQLRRSVVGLRVLREVPGPDVGSEGRHRRRCGLAEPRVLPHELGNRARPEAEEVVEDQDLAVAVRASPDPDRGDGQLLGDPCRDDVGDALEHHREAPRVAQGVRGVEQRAGAVGVPRLHTVAPHRQDGLRREPE